MLKIIKNKVNYLGQRIHNWLYVAFRKARPVNELIVPDQVWLADFH